MVKREEHADGSHRFFGFFQFRREKQRNTFPAVHFSRFDFMELTKVHDMIGKAIGILHHFQRLRLVVVVVPASKIKDSQMIAASQCFMRTNCSRERKKLENPNALRKKLCSI